MPGVDAAATAAMTSVRRRWGKDGRLLLLLLLRLRLGLGLLAMLRQEILPSPPPNEPDDDISTRPASTPAQSMAPVIQNSVGTMEGGMCCESPGHAHGSLRVFARQIFKRQLNYPPPAVEPASFVRSPLVAALESREEASCYVWLRGRRP